MTTETRIVHDITGLIAYVRDFGRLSSFVYDQPLK
jgi:hypothetical protein